MSECRDRDREDADPLADITYIMSGEAWYAHVVVPSRSNDARKNEMTISQRRRTAAQTGSSSSASGT
jgi:hypothetical protein